MTSKSPDNKPKKVVFTGTIHISRSEGKDADRCICCKGNHIYSRGIEFDEEMKWGLISAMLDTQDKHTIDGKRVKITFEVEELSNAK